MLMDISWGLMVWTVVTFGVMVALVVVAATWLSRRVRRHRARPRTTTGPDQV